MKRMITVTGTLLLLIALTACGTGDRNATVSDSTPDTPDVVDAVVPSGNGISPAIPPPPSSASDEETQSPAPHDPTATPVPDEPTPVPSSEIQDEPSSSSAASYPAPSVPASTVPSVMETPSENAQEPEPSVFGNEEGNTALQIQVQGNEHTIVFELNDSPAARSLYDQLPLSIEVQDYGSNEKIFYPPDELDTTDALPAEGPAGGLAYFSPWGNVVMFYSSYGPYSGLYQLGRAISGSEWIETLSGTLEIQALTQ